MMNDLDNNKINFENPIWLKNYDSHVPHRVEVPDKTLYDYLLQSAEKFPDNKAFTFLGYSMTYRQLINEVYKAYHMLKNLNIGFNDCIVLILPNTPHFIILTYAGLMLGAKICPLNLLSSPYQIKRQINELKPKIIIVQDLLYDKISDFVEESDFDVMVTDLRDYISFKLKAYVSLGKAMGKFPKIPVDIFKYRNLMKYGSSKKPDLQSINPEKTVAAMLFTGGTTGEPKMVMLSHKNIVSNMLYQKIWFKREEGRETVLGLLPFFHAYGFGSILALSIALAANLVLMIKFDVNELYDNLIRYKVTLFPAAPTIYIAMLNNIPPEKLEKLSGVLELCFSGAFPLPVEIIKRWEEVTKCRIVEGYGLTETSPVVSANPVYGVRKMGSIGVPMPNTLVAVADLNEPILIEGKGEIVVNGSQVMIGYYKHEEENKNAFFECCNRRWFRTGDIGYMDEDGFFFIIDRKKDMIKYKGHAVYPRYIEEVLYENSCVSEAAVIGVPDPLVGENIKAFIVPKKSCEGSVKEEDIIKWCKERLGGHEYPRIVEFRDTLPKSPAGKILKRILREEEAKKEK